MFEVVMVACLFPGGHCFKVEAPPAVATLQECRADERDLRYAVETMPVVRTYQWWQVTESDCEPVGEPA